MRMSSWMLRRGGMVAAVARTAMVALALSPAPGWAMRNRK
jgi:hypothetical protein